MVLRARGQIDFEREGFIARFDNDAAIVGKIREIQRRGWVKDKAAWSVDPHWPSVRRLLHIASELDWEVSADAREAAQRIRSESELLEYSVDVVHDNHGAAWFQCKLGDDDRLLEQVRAIPGAYWEEAWWIPTDWEKCCAPLLEIVQSDMRLEVSEAAWLLLEEPDVADRFLRSSVPPAAAAESAEPTQLLSTTRREQSVALEDRQAYERELRDHAERLRAMDLDHADLPDAPADREAGAEARRRQQLDSIQRVLHECGRQKLASVAGWIAPFVAREEPLVVFAHHPDVLAALHARFPLAASITGAETSDQRDQAVQRFQNGKTQLIFCSTSAVNLGITLTRAAHFAFAELSWNAAAHAQAEERIHRIERTPAPTVWYLAAEDTIDSIVLSALDRKRELAEQLNERVLSELGDAIAQTAHVGRKARVSTRGKRAPAEAAEKDAGGAFAQRKS